ncbi:hypothetical protein [Corynebacterium halotolerans]|uniref:AAA domain-containing protein n=1 Tax=Corynebacterium halotolerans YIM 70093 = DSM 44683 TaxID=1121362 RepID=M1NJ90_9CORY|nr:hypothetical protein [Corynebacterium halotolerans]AGF71463.1 hypothetical protein A605_02245 [Corynebacterium halotolerans YIM 70093 = DSM 44683]
MSWSEIRFLPVDTAVAARHHTEAAAGNARVADTAEATLLQALADAPDADGATTHLLLKAAAGAGKSFILRRLITAAVEQDPDRLIGVAAFTNNQIRPLALGLARQLGRERVCLHLAKTAAAGLPDGVEEQVTVTTSAADIPDTARVIVATAHKFKAPGERHRLLDALREGEEDATLFDALFIDEAWQLPHHLFDAIHPLAPLAVGVGDVGQLPPLEIGENPWRGDPRHNPYRAWPTAYAGLPGTREEELPTVWRPPGEALALWRAFYPDWRELNSVAAPGDRVVRVGSGAASASLWEQVGTGQPTLLEVTGLPDSEAPDVDLPLMARLEEWLDELFTAGFTVESRDYDGTGAPTGEMLVDGPDRSDDGDPLVVILATRNQAVDDATDMVARLRERHGLRERDLLASTVDSWQGQTNAITVAFHPLSGATRLDEFNSAFGRLAVACTRATHGLLVVTREGLDELLDRAPARPGTPFGEPGFRQLPRQTHQKIIAAFARGTVSVDAGA